jgi:hypothetical protein
VVRSIVDMAHSLKLMVAAEGVETVEQRDGLIALDADQGQGYLFAHPQPAHELGALLGTDVQFRTQRARLRDPLFGVDQKVLTLVDPVIRPRSRNVYDRWPCSRVKNLYMLLYAARTGPRGC